MLLMTIYFPHRHFKPSLTSGGVYVHVHVLQNTKLYLMPEDFQGLPALPAGLSVRKLVADFLACLVDLINSTLEAHNGNR